MYPLSISVGEKQQLIESGVVIQFNNQPVEFNLELTNFPLKIIMVFKNDSKTEPHMEPATIDNTTLSLILYNYNNPLGTGSTRPLKIADYQGKHIYLNYRIYSLSDTSDKTVQYSFYLSEVLI
ncbi:DUF6864 domain-containing function [Sporosarcina sp. 179-K 8C2 HS]|uniref:DUF6864 domain-containing function n=1 Tax=Sporosarcina sp. 179-K 8C2 HS TaxID=3142387 RepID=UPI0039A0F628